MKLSGADIVVRVLIEQGCNVVFGYPGGQILNVYDSLYKYSNEIEHVLSAHEQGAVHAADGYARSTGKTGVVIATSGPGATNLVTGIATAFLDSIPLVAICGNVPTSQIGSDSFQEIASRIIETTSELSKVLGYIPENPYNHFEDKRGRYKPRKPLTRDELEALRSLPLSGRLDRVRDLFVFCCYTGLAVADLAAFSYEQHVVERNGMLYIDGNRIKTGTEFFTPLLKPARDILTKYDNKLPVISGQKYNDYLHVIEAKLGLKKPLTSHVARHTFATTVCLGNDIPIETVSKMLGHRHVSTTEIYAKVLQENVERAARSLDDIL